MDGFEKRNKRHLLDKWDREVDLHNGDNAANQDFQEEQFRRDEALRAHEDEQRAIQALRSNSHISPSGGHSVEMSASQKVTALRNSRGSERLENYKPEERERNHTRQRQRTRERGERTR